MAGLTVEQRRAIAIARAKAAAAARAESSGRGFMPHLNQGIADAAGGLADFLNPFDTDDVSRAVGMGDRLSTGSAVPALEKGMDAIGVNRADGEPENFVESLGRGAGEAAVYAPVGGLLARGLSSAGGVIGGVADDASKAINSAGGFFTEMLAGAGAQAGSDIAEREGAGELGQGLAGLLGGVGLAAVPAALRYTPTAIGARAVGQKVKEAMMPYTDSGALEVARRRVQELAGGQDRARGMAGDIANGSEIGLSPAQMTGDPNMLGLEQEAMRQSPIVREAIESGMDQSAAAARGRLPGAGGDVAAAQGFFEQRRADARDAITTFIDRATNGALRPEARRTETRNSEIVTEQILQAEKQMKEYSDRLWSEIPMGVQVGTGRTMQVASELIAETPRAQRGDIPRVVGDLLSGEGGFGEFETVREMHGLYSELRRIARSAMAGNDQNRNMARIANGIADAILDDLGAGSGATEIGRKIDEARAVSAEMHEIFDRGAVGRILRRTLDGDEQIAPGVALDRTAGRGGNAGDVAAGDLLRAADTDVTQEAFEDYLTSQFDRAAFRSNGEFTATGAGNFLRDNQQLLRRFPYLADTLAEAARTQSRAASVAERGGRVMTDMDNPARSGTAAFTQAAPENAVDQVFKAKRPSIAARLLSATARKDESGQALGGLKAAFSDYLIGRTSANGGMSAAKMTEFLSSPERRSALAAVYDPVELRRLDVIAAELGKLDAARRPAPNIGALSNRSPNRIIEYVARVIAARQGAQAGGSTAGSLQTAQMASTQMRRALGSLQNDKAEKLLMDAVTDPELFRLLLTDPGRVELTPEQINRLAPYFAGATSAVLTE